MTALIVLENVRKEYDGVVALRDASLTIEEGEFVTIVGPSGSGKSTLLQLVGTLDRPSSGTVTIDGYNIATLTDRELSALRAQRIGFVFQQFHLAPGVSALENVSEGMLYQGIDPARRRKLAATALERVGLGHRLDHRPHELSGGERQRVAVARATAGSPTILLADEPTGNLDSRSGDDVMSLLDDLHKEGTTVIVITHDPDVAASAPRQINIKDGEVAA
ncbi:MAG: ABC transporter ATP-binding protein [Candidatus Lumbricidophila eiseniae]|uniref:ABC transporter ATP-binding protein n=1 Tax=Candidatus Lumbricidiphila eiseniae TaxID=1969409 RepID=A0A2A6FRH0_9MICO|nr:MAG: ABC transporter ATP-binding protein [Candidatus Lumbricidophila eiseniae]